MIKKHMLLMLACCLVPVIALPAMIAATIKPTLNQPILTKFLINLPEA